MSITKVEMQVIDDKLLIDSILNVMNPNEAESLRGQGEPNLVDIAPAVSSLILSFKGIGRIENLVGFDNLVKLCLDNNSVEDMSPVGALVKLQWLDMSFNKIRKIQGLEALSDLRDLSLYCNKITVIEGLDKCKNLECLSLGSNRIANTDQLIKLRQIKSLKMLAIAGNPVMQDPECVSVTLAYVETLAYLDYALVEPVDRHNAKEAYHDELIDVEEKEGVLMEKISRDATTAEYKIYLSKAGCLYAYIIFDDMVDGDTDLDKLRHLPGVKDLVETFRQNFKTLSETYLKTALEKYEVRTREVAAFTAEISSVREKDDAQSTSLIDKFNAKNKELVLLLTKETPKEPYSVAEVSRMVEALSSELDVVCDELMSLEMRQVEKFDALVDDFDNRLNEGKNVVLEMQTSFFRAVEALEDKFSQDVAALIVDLMGRLAREELAEDFLDDEAMTLLMDKESCMGVLSLSHDVHIGRILKLEDQARNNETKSYAETVQGFMSAERIRNRNRVLEIHDYCRSAKVNMQALLVADDEEADGEDAQ